MKKLEIAFTFVTLTLAGCRGGGDGNGPPIILNVKPDMVYVMTNANPDNEVIAMVADNNGSLTFFNNYGTGGSGTGQTEVSPATPQDGIDPLASQSSLAITAQGSYLFACNAGSHNVSSFTVDEDGSLHLVDIEPSGGFQPNSIDTHGNLLYVSNVGNTGNGFNSNVTGFHIESNGSLTLIAGSTRTLSTATAQPSCVTFDTTGTLLAVSELTTDKVTIFPVNPDGTLGTPVNNSSSAAAPFGSFFLSDGRLLVTEAQPGSTGSLSSYNVDAAGTATVISSAIGNNQVATCWIAVSENQSFAYVTNTGSDSVSSYSIATNGTLAVVNPVASTLEGGGSGPIDLGIGSGGKYLYVLNGAQGTITLHQINSDGSLNRIEAFSHASIPSLGSQGLVTR